jgi:hypothetical protein
MDLYQGQVAPADQIHDFNPDNPFNVFWTVFVPDNSVQVNLPARTAELTINNLALQDFRTLANALTGGPGVPATVSYEIEWRGELARVDVRDTVNRFVGHFIEDTATIAWTAAVPQKNFRFVSDPANTSTTVFAEIGRDRNGVFFS